MSERRMSKVVTKAGGLDQAEIRKETGCGMARVFDCNLSRDATGDLCDLERVRESRSIEVAVAQIQNLRLALKATKRP
jgi:hypothetical protein